jgi:hypothetical protein
MGRAGNPSLQSQPAPVRFLTRGTKVSIREKFSHFHQAHPEICSALVTLAREARDRGAKRYSIRTIYGVLRFQIAFAETRIISTLTIVY